MEQLELFQQKMVEQNINAYIIPTNDYHGSEYVGDFFKGRNYLSGFTGSAGTLVVLQNKSYLWTDGRYYIQASKQIEGNNIELMKMDQKDVPSIIDFLVNTLKPGDTLAFDGKVMATTFVIDLKNKLNPQIKIKADIDLINDVWKDRPELPFSVIYKLNEIFTGKPYKDKLKEIKEKMAEYNCDMHIISSLEDQAWLYNLRANDVLHTPVFLAFTVITNESTTLFVNLNKLTIDVEKYLDENEIVVRPYEAIYKFCQTINNKKILMDLSKTNYLLYETLENANLIIDRENPSLLLKAIKNDVEIANIKEAHIKDGVSMTKLMYQIKNNLENGIEMTELSLTKLTEKLRKENKGFVDLSFSTICAFKEHGAMMHYSATPESDVKIEGNSFLLIDSGGHYLEGTTDVTRTFAVGRITDQMRVHYTTVLKSVINLSQAIFLRGCTGMNLDVLAREPIWKTLIDYKCGTGHGVGNLLSVHEAPNAFRWKKSPNRNEAAPIEPGMITTNEPGIYLEDKYGIRIENEMLCVSKKENEWGEFLGFETLTFVPIDLDAIKPSLLTKEEKEWLNQYHQMVYDTISPHLTDDEAIWLKDYTRSI